MSTAERGYLLDTHTFIWAATDDPKLGGQAKKVILDADNHLFLSVASVWEMAIKSSVGKLELQTPLANLVQSQVQAIGVVILDVQREHALGVEYLTLHHRDPFDRLLVAQAIHERLTLISCDPSFDDYQINLLW